MENSLLRKMTDQETLEMYDRNIEILHAQLFELKKEAPYNRRMSYDVIQDQIENYENKISALERSRKSLFERMSVKQAPKVWYKSEWFITTLVAILGAITTLIAALLD